MKTLIFIKGVQGVGKSLLASLIKESVEVHDLTVAEAEARTRQVYKPSTAENIVFTSNDASDYERLSSKLRTLAQGYNRVYFELTTEDFG